METNGWKKGAAWLFLSLGMMICAVLAFGKSGSAAAINLGQDWVSVPTNELLAEDTFYYAKYGDLSITRNQQGIYIENKNAVIYEHGGEAYICYGGVFTNGQDVLYQDGKQVYLYQDCKKKKKLFSLPKKSDVLVAVYGSTVYYGRETDLDSYRLYKYQLNTKKRTKLGFMNAYYCYHKYLVVEGQFHEGVETPLVLYHMGTGATQTVTRKGIYGNGVILSGTKVYYTEFNMKKEKSTLMIYDLKTRKRQRVKKRSGAFFWLDSRHYFCVKNEVFYVYDARTGEVTTY